MIISFGNKKRFFQPTNGLKSHLVSCGSELCLPIQRCFSCCTFCFSFVCIQFFFSYICFALYVLSCFVCLISFYMFFTPCKFSAIFISLPMPKTTNPEMWNLVKIGEKTWKQKILRQKTCRRHLIKNTYVKQKFCEILTSVFIKNPHQIDEN